MLAFGLNKKLCSDFLKKQATIGNLDEGRGEPGEMRTPFVWSQRDGARLPGRDALAPSQCPFLSPPQSNTSCSATTSSRWPPNSRLAGTLRRRDGSQSGWGGERNPPPGLPETEAGLLKKKKKKDHTHKLQ